MKPWYLVLATGILLILAYEVRANIGDDYPTLTALIRQATVFNAIVALQVGILMGHLFWPR